MDGRSVSVALIEELTVTVSQSTNRAALISQTCGCSDGQELSNLRRAEKVRLRLISVVSADGSTSAPLPLAQSTATSMVAEQKRRFQAVQRVTLFCKFCFAVYFRCPSTVLVHPRLVSTIIRLMRAQRILSRGFQPSLISCLLARPAHPDSGIRRILRIFSPSTLQMLETIPKPAMTRLKEFG